MPRPRRPEDLRRQIIIRKKAGIDNTVFAGEIARSFLYPTFQAAIEGLVLLWDEALSIEETSQPAN